MQQDQPPNTVTCLTQCDPNQNPNTICTPLCSHICPYVCNTTQPPPTVDYFLLPPPKHHHSPLSLPLNISLAILVLTFSLFLLYKLGIIWYRSRTCRLLPPPPPPPPENQENLDY
ncbi:hypothetical protein L6452_40696 [Arctium lappa]|uniref:Uncharacterized protein n=1 Tax=Arctium lappa TaxID=4217 RepID=A0ACB8XN68_ARCLA|nr:hypothetical protein L6452_40696 [Arctium lappa]